MGRRHRNHVFMPHAYVFPGGLRRPGRQYAAARQRPCLPMSFARLQRGANPTPGPGPSPAAAVRETFEETGLLLGAEDADAPGRLSPRSGRARLLLPGNHPRRDAPRRFDARFLVAEATDIHRRDRATGDGELLDVGIPLPRRHPGAGHRRYHPDQRWPNFERWIAEPAQAGPPTGWSRCRNSCAGATTIAPE